MQVEMADIVSIKPYENNPRLNDDAVISVALSIQQFGFRQPIVVDKERIIVVGHTRWRAAKRLNMTQIPVHVADLTPDQARAYRIADNQTGQLAQWDDAKLVQELKALNEKHVDINGLGFDKVDIDKMLGQTDITVQRPSLFDQFLIPPFSVLNSREGHWQERKQQWTAGYELASFAGRGEDGDDQGHTGGVLFKSMTAHPEFYKQKSNIEAKLGKKITTEEFIQLYFIPPTDALAAGTSIFDPVLCEILLRWFSPRDAIILDPFAGGSVRGIVSSALQRRYIGIDVRQEQIDANLLQFTPITQR